MKAKSSLPLAIATAIAPAILAMGLSIGPVGSAAALPPCPAQPVLGEVSVEYHSGSGVPLGPALHVSRRYDPLWALCAHEKEAGTVTVVARRAGEVVFSKEVSLRYGLRGSLHADRLASVLTSTIAAHEYCPPDPPAKAPLPSGPPLFQDLYLPVAVEIDIVATGGYAPLAYSGKATGYCLYREFRAWPTSRRLDWEVNKEGELSLRIEAPLPWFEGARPVSELQLRMFVGPDRVSVLAATRPVKAVEGLEKRFKTARNPGYRILELTMPVPDACQGNARVVGWELTGKGYLDELSHGRQIEELPCSP